MGSQTNAGGTVAAPPRAFKKTSNWVYYGVLMSVLAVFLAAGIDLLLGYSWKQIRVERLPDIFLACFAISSNLKSLIEDDDDKISDSQHDVFDKICNLTMLITLAIYLAVFKLIDMVSPENSVYFFVACIAIILLNASLGIYITRK